MKPALIVGLHLRWDGVRQRPQHLLSRLANDFTVIVIEEPFIITAGNEGEQLHDFEGVTVIRPLRRSPQTFIDSHTIAVVRDLIEGRETIVWLYQPMMLELADAFRGAPLVYDCMDDLAAFAFAPPAMHEREDALLARADLVFSGGRTLYERHKSLGEKVHLAPSGVEYERFAQARSLQPHPAVAALEPPRYGYLGVIDERIDVALLEALSAAPESPNVIMVGPLAKIDPEILPRKANVHFTGQLEYETLPSILAGLEVALMPFAQNESTRSISPTKTLEYLAAGVPVVSTPIADVVADYADVVAIADAERFVDACRQASSAPNHEQIELGRRRARDHGWDAIAERMRDELTKLEARRSVI